MYRMPVSEPIRNIDTRTVGTVVNQTTAIRIDDSTVDVRRTWSSKKINEAKADSNFRIIDEYQKAYGSLFLSMYEPHHISQWAYVIEDAQAETEAGKPFLIPWNEYQTVQVIKADSEAKEKVLFFFKGQTWAFTDDGIFPVYMNHGDAKITMHTTAEWNEIKTYVPDRAEVCIYSDREIIDGIPRPGIKIGDGNSHVIDLPFFGEDKYNKVIEELDAHMSDATSHVSVQDRSFWNSKLNFTQNGEVLTFNRL